MRGERCRFLIITLKIRQKKIKKIGIDDFLVIRDRIKNVEVHEDEQLKKMITST